MERHVVLKFNLKSGEDDQSLRTVRVGSDHPVIVGRSSRDESKGMVSSSDNLHIANSVISRNHARITYESKDVDDKRWAVLVEDTNSSHGIFLNGVKVAKNTKREIANGDNIGFGVSIKRSDGPTHLSPVYTVNLAEGPMEKDCTPGRSWTMPVESDYDEFDEYDEFCQDVQEDHEGVDAILAEIYESEAEEESLDEDFESQDLSQNTSFSPPQAYYEDSNSEEEEQDDEGGEMQVRDEAPTSGQVGQSSTNIWAPAPITPKADRSLLTPEDELIFDPPSIGVRTNSTFWDAVLEHPSAAPAETTSPRVLQIRELLSAAPPQPLKRKFEYDTEDLGESSTVATHHTVIPETMLSSSIAFARSDEGENDTTLVEERNDTVAQFLKEPSKVEMTTQTEVHRTKRSRLGDVAFGVGMFMAGSASAIAALATLPDGFFA